MIIVAAIILSAVAAAITLVTAMLMIEILAARKSPPSPMNALDERPRATILIPAHDEEIELPACLESLKGQLGPHDQILVVADNCTDKTATIARDHGVLVLERHDPTHMGKGYALQFGLDHLADDPPDVVIILDADCRAEAGTIETLSLAAIAQGRPIQALDLMEAGTDAGLAEKISAFAFTVKNWTRPSGLRRLGRSCLLMGTGMAFPWTVIRSAGLGTGNIVEDVKLGIDLTLASHPPLFEDRARVTSRFPSAGAAQLRQRKRWEHGHLATIIEEVPRLIGVGLKRRQPALLVTALDLSIPPLSLLALMILATGAASAIVALFGGSTLPLILVGISAGLATVAVAVAWRGYGRTILSVGELLSIPFYVARKIPIYLGFVRGRERQWVRSSRGDENARQ